MNVSLVVADDFYPEPMKLREAVLGSEFKTETGPDGAVYTGISQFKDESLFELTAALMHCRIQPKMSFWRLNLAGEKANSIVHSDGTFAKWAAILYLNTPEQCAKHYSGTGFFKHTALGIDSMPTEETLRAAGVNLAAFNQNMLADWRSPEPWELTGYTGMKFNRFVAYPTSRFHSRYPHEAFGSTVQDGRLIWVCFFDIVP